MLQGLYILDDFDLIYGSTYEEIGKLVNIYAPPQTRLTIRQNITLLKNADVIFTGWGSPIFDNELLSAAPNLKAVFYGAGSVKSIVTDEFWERNIKMTSAYAANAEPVVEFTLSQILFSLKRGWYFVIQSKKQQNHVNRVDVPGAYGTTVGIVSLGMIGKKVCELLKPFDVRVIAYDPYISQKEAEKLNLELCSLEEVFRHSDVVSVHTPWLKETEGLINGELLSSMKQNATFINTSRGAIVNEPEMIDVLKTRPDLFAILDVTYPEPPIEGSLLYTLDNVILTPHIAGSMSGECHRMGAYMLEELKRFVAGKELKWEITKEKALIMA
ncbi:hydroxyacid dehydrogenase [Lederbergia wuyishanensis]|uniref:Phosphoglycerate dehydrogenase-like enzyme n=1 Tax=Lederbergia wuyishanensis TaxID=1347903 RepID=A0ABU0D1R4_9BACI|nr:hydroxyacid dehydrogenase [Lederbergia wuyishanensis]MCJ8006965.1 hydroxyacid dehydrogenase [Lederbergia wuyishanensis]MDQ0342349.1 phosphoglycerate dehydrogenase-like enzyme [Lederbergia wuyishanensis]